MSYADLSSPGTFRSSNSYTIKYGKTNPYYYKGNVAVLVNGITISAAEVLTLAKKKRSGCNRDRRTYSRSTWTCYMPTSSRRSLHKDNGRGSIS